MKISTVSKAVLTILVAGMSLAATPVFAAEATESNPALIYPAEDTANQLTVDFAAPTGHLEAVALQATVYGEPGAQGTVVFEVIDASGMMVNGAFTPFVIGADGTATIKETVSQDVPSPTFTFVAKVTDANGVVKDEKKHLAQIVDSAIFGTSPAAALNPSQLKSITRLSGSDRIQTAATISKSQFAQGANGVILVNSEVFADATTAASLSAAYQMPVLLTQANELATQTAQEIGRLLPHGGDVFILGGTSAVSQEIQNELASKFRANVTRLAGPSRVETAEAVAEHLVLMGKANQFVVVDSNDWQSAVLAGPVAAKTSGAVLLSVNGVVSPAADALIQSLPASNIATIGTPATVFKGDAHGRTVQTFAAGDVTARSLDVAKAFFPTSKVVGIATTAAFPDGIVGSASIAKQAGPMILLDPNAVSTAAASFVSESSFNEGYVFGGEQALPDHIIEAAF